MNEDLLVLCKAHGIGTLCIQHPTVSQAVHANENGTGDFLDVIYAVSDLLGRTDIQVDDWDIDEIHDGDDNYGIQLVDYTGTTVKTHIFEKETA